MLPQIVERIFAICKNDSNFPLKNKMSNVDDTLSEIQTQINKQDKLINQSKSLSTNIVARLSNLKSSNQDLKERLLEELGSEL